MQVMMTGKETSGVALSSAEKVGNIYMLYIIGIVSVVSYNIKMSLFGFWEGENMYYFGEQCEE